MKFYLISILSYILFIIVLSFGKNKKSNEINFNDSLITDTLSDCCCNSVLIKTPDYTGAVFDTLYHCWRSITFKKPKNLYEYFKQTDSVFQEKYWPKTWMPSDIQIDSAENIIKKYLLNNKSQIKVEYLPEYLRQYFGEFDEKGDKIICVNFFLKYLIESFPKWRNELVLAYGGGSGFWNITVNLEKDTCFGFFVNAPE